MGASREIWKDASEYFFIINCPLLFRGSLIVYGNILRANKDSKTPLYINLSVNILNIMLNQLLIGTGTAFVLFGEKIVIPGAGWGCERSCFCYSAQSEHRRNCNFYCCDA
ncbi:MAG: MATE family efflux transporter [Mediterraneibacter gnavus]